ncbi:MAG: YdeI/OmpD-associated family protein [Firmicutes bacterium]|nr:YdeI/OmpD-associated family protein [Bacillota bacterium]
MSEDYSKLKRPKQAMPGFVKQALKKRGLMEAYKKRPAYQQNDYLGWINEAKLQETKKKRLSQMLDELEKGGIYMNMDHPESKK